MLRLHGKSEGFRIEPGRGKGVGPDDGDPGVEDQPAHERGDVLDVRDENVHDNRLERGRCSRGRRRRRRRTVAVGLIRRRVGEPVEKPDQARRGADRGAERDAVRSETKADGDGRRRDGPLESAGSEDLGVVPGREKARGTAS